MRGAERSLRVAAVARAAAGDLLEEAHREEVPQPIDAGIIGRVAVLLVELAEPAVLVPAELVETSLVAGVVDRSGDAGGALRGEEDVVVCRRLCRKLLHHDVPFRGAAGSLTR